MKIVPLHLREANALVAKWHGHHKPVHNHKFGIGCEHKGKLAAAAICARPASCALDDDATLEVARLVSDGTDLVCSKPYGAAARIAKEMGFEKIQTYILDS